VIPVGILLSTTSEFVTGKPAFVGEATIEGKITDARTGQLLVAGIDRRVGGDEIEASVDSWNSGPSGSGSGYVKSEAKETAFDPNNNFQVHLNGQILYLLKRDQGIISWVSFSYSYSRKFVGFRY
jgi:hypothetical protein